MRPPEQGPDLIRNLRTGVNIFTLWTDIHSVPADVILRRFGTMGPRAIGLNLLLWMAYSSFWFLCSAREQGYFNLLFYVTVGCFVLHRITAKRGGHPRYNGTSWLSRDDRVKKYVEPLVCFFGGAILMQRLPMLGLYVFLCSVSLYAKFYLWEGELNQKLEGIVAGIEEGKLVQETLRERGYQ